MRTSISFAVVAPRSSARSDLRGATFVTVMELADVPIVRRKMQEQIFESIPSQEHSHRIEQVDGVSGESSSEVASGGWSAWA